MPPRALWSGTISFGLVNVPVRLYGAIHDHTLHFNFVHAKDGSRIGYEKVCKAEGKPVPAEEIVRAFEYERGEFVYMTDEDFDAAKVEAARGRGSRVASGGDDDGGLEELSKGELYERAKQRDIPGRSQMSREELVEALRAA